MSYNSNLQHAACLSANSLERRTNSPLVGSRIDALGVKFHMPLSCGVHRIILVSIVAALKSHVTGKPRAYLMRASSLRRYTSTSPCHLAFAVLLPHTAPLSSDTVSVTRWRRCSATSTPARDMDLVCIRPSVRVRVCARACVRLAGRQSL